MLNSFRLLSLIEGLSLITLLFIAMPARYQFGVDFVWPVGMAHGVLWLAFVVMSLLVSHLQRIDPAIDHRVATGADPPCSHDRHVLMVVPHAGILGVVEMAGLRRDLARVQIRARRFVSAKVQPFHFDQVFLQAEGRHVDGDLRARPFV